MALTIEQKLLTAIFGENYAVGLPKLDSDWTWKRIIEPADDNQRYAQDIEGRWFVATYDPDYDDD